MYVIIIHRLKIAVFVVGVVTMNALRVFVMIISMLSLLINYTDIIIIHLSVVLGLHVVVLLE